MARPAGPAKRIFPCYLTYSDIDGVHRVAKKLRVSGSEVIRRAVRALLDVDVDTLRAQEPKNTDRAG
jgi:hypothetical protein